jgi:hypothetical protein
MAEGSRYNPTGYRPFPLFGASMKRFSEIFKPSEFQVYFVL